MAELTDWTLLRSFLAVMRQGSLSAAARITGQTQPTVGRHIDEIEQGLGVTLFTRSSGGLLPTDPAKSLVVHAEAMETAFASLVRAASQGGDITNPRGTVRITASDIMGTFALPAILADIRFRYPDIVLELALSNRNEDLLRREADIAVRMTRPVQDGLVARKIGEVPLSLYAHRRYAERFGLPKKIDDLLHHQVVGFDRDDHSARAVVSGKLPVTREIFTLRTDSDVAQVAAVRAGLGIGMVQCAIAATDANLVPVLAKDVLIMLQCWLVVHEDQRNVAPVRAVFDGLMDGLRGWLMQKPA